MSTRSKHGSSPIHGSGWNVAAECIEPLYDMFVAANEIVLTIDLPFVNPKGIRLQCPATNVLEVYAETSKKITFKELGVKHRHGEFKCYHARVQMPVPVKDDTITEKLKRGVLEVHIQRLR